MNLDTRKQVCRCFFDDISYSDFLYTVENPPEITPPNTSIEGIGEAATDKYLALLMTILAMFAIAGIRRVFE